MKQDAPIKKVKTVLHGVGPSVCPLKARVIDELLGLCEPAPQVTKKKQVVRVSKLKGEKPSKSLYRLWAAS